MEVLAQRTIALSKAPMAEAYSGPVILSGNASAVFFHEVFGHRLERKDSEFASMKGQQVLPSDFSITCNPQQQYSGETPLTGYYQYDDEGSMGKKVECVIDGKMANMLTCLSQQAATNGHGRSAFGSEAAPRQSNLMVETSHPYTETELRMMLISELKRQNKDYGYYIKTVSNGWTTLRGSAKVASSFNVFPMETYRVYADGRADELVRGVSLIGTPLSAFSNIRAAGGDVEVFNGRCGSGSGWIPVSSRSPMIYVSQIETQVIDHGEGETDTSSRPDFQTWAENGLQNADSVNVKNITAGVYFQGDSIHDHLVASHHRLMRFHTLAPKDTAEAVKADTLSVTSDRKRAADGRKAAKQKAAKKKSSKQKPAKQKPSKQKPDKQKPDKKQPSQQPPRRDRVRMDAEE